jgi:hypothetical protein
MLKDHPTPINTTLQVNKLRILLLLVATVTTATSHAASYDKADKLAAKMPSSATKSCKLMTDYIKSNVTTEEEYLRVAYMWMAKNIGFEKGGDIDLTSSYDDDSLANVIIKRKKAVCSGYAELFTKLCIKMGFQAYTVVGYTMLNKEIDEDGHAWNAVQLSNGQWKLFDPMWGAGSLSKGKFSKGVNDRYFMVDPATFLKTHMPFDPTWQLMDYPIKAEAFYKEEVGTKGKVYFSYNDTIKASSKLFKSEQLESLCRRLEWAENSNSCSNMMLDIARQNIIVLKKREKYALENRKVNAFNSVVDRVNIIIEDYNKFVAVKKTFRAKKISALNLKTQIDSCGATLAAARQDLMKLTFETDDQKKRMTDLSKTIQSLQKQVDVQLAFLKKQKEFKKAKKKK